jgi:hypothetical protein
VRGFLPQAEQFARDCEDAAADWKRTLEGALLAGEHAAATKARLRAGDVRHDTLIRVVLATLKTTLCAVEHKSSAASLLAEIEATEDLGLKLEAVHATHGRACSCDSAIDELGGRHRTLVSDFVAVYEATEMAKRVATALFAEPTLVEQRTQLCAAIRATSLLLLRARKAERRMRADVLARGVIVSFCRSMPELGRKLQEHEAAIASAIEAAAARGRPRRGLAPKQDSSETLATLLRLVGLQASREALRSERKRKKWGAVDAP